ncbi:pyruvate kinase [Salipiger sp. 1_MG-2023]|uniref:pyruvate kinase n=1 Tax=Salipiger sp. 1_MG-2023 TaxID=3062665 RepID=UPI0026E3E9AC|nr:pyruvate kinase [Salipiger sp. 1_MG-2023]MDO6587632.1 pyruvate kinase [Salipiger sp. 1_MG-2023]
MLDRGCAALRTEVHALREAVLGGAATRLAKWHGWIERDAYRPSAGNLAQYLALRQHDIRPLQRALMQCGLSSLERAQSRVMPELDALCAVLDALTSDDMVTPVPIERFFAGQARIAARAEALFGPMPRGSKQLMVTLPTEAADGPAFCEQLARAGAGAVRINCADDGPAAWRAMIEHTHAAGGITGRRMKVLMDLPGPRIRTGAMSDTKGLRRIHQGDALALALPGRLHDVPRGVAGIECSLAAPIHALCARQRVFIDDGKLACRVAQRAPWGVLLTVERAPPQKGYKLKPDKRLNFPDCALDIPALTAPDRDALRFALDHADGVVFPFVQRVGDVEDLQEFIAAKRPGRAQSFGLVLKIETERALRNLPDMLVRAAGRQPTAVMIARGDLSVEIGFARLAEIQEEILSLCDAAQVPAIWASAVLESFLKTGLPTRGEMSDAAMGARAQCVLLNTGPYLLDAMAELTRLFDRMPDHLD